MSAIPKTKLTPAEYLEFERKSETKHEYFDGEIFAMSGAKWNHNVIAWNIGGELRQ
jgi:Uma2 family endonuclease